MPRVSTGARVRKSCRRRTGRLAPICALGALLATSAGAVTGPGDAVPEAPADSARGAVWTTLYVPDGTTLYVRYGEPGAVRIQRGPAGSERAASGTPPAPPVRAAAGPPDGREMIARLLREELARARRLGEGAADTLSHPGAAPPAPAGAGGGVVVVDRPAGGQEMAVAASDSAGASPPEASEPGTNLEPAVPPTPDTRVIREEFLDTGLFRTSLVLFETNRAGLLPPSRDVLRAVGRVLREFPEARLRVEGHCDERGPAAFNLRLSRERADAVRDFLVAEMGIDAGRIEAVGYGEERPLMEGHSATALAWNRRVEFRILNPEALERPGDER